MQKYNKTLLSESEIKKDIDNNLDKIFRNYKIYKRNKKIFITGVLLLRVENKIINRYSIEIEMPDMRERYYPTVWEIGNKIPKIADRHFYSNGIACLFYPDDFLRFFNKNTKISEFIKGPIFTFFLSQTYKDITGKWIFGELDHNEFGAFDYYSQKFGVKNSEIIAKFLDFVLDKFHIRKSQLCLCGSNKEFRKCHRGILVEIKNSIPQKMILISVKRILDYNSQINSLLKIDKVIKEVNRKTYKSIDIKYIWYNEYSISRLMIFFNRKIIF